MELLSRLARCASWSPGGHGEDFRGRALDKARAIRFYEARSRHYSRLVQRGPLRYLRERERNAVLELCRFDDVESRTVVDVGCGDGFYALEAKRAGKWVHAIDIAVGMIDQVRQRVDRAEVADLEAFEPERTYDIVVCSGVLEFVPDPELAFQRLRNLVSPHGRLVVQVPRAGWPGFAYRIEKGLYGIRVNLFSRQWFEDRARRSGLKLKSWRSPLPTNMVLLLEPPARAPSRNAAHSTLQPGPTPSRRATSALGVIAAERARQRDDALR